MAFVPEPKEKLFLTNSKLTVRVFCEDCFQITRVQKNYADLRRFDPPCFLAIESGGYGRGHEMGGHLQRLSSLLTAKGPQSHWVNIEVDDGPRGALVVSDFRQAYAVLVHWSEGSIIF